MVVERNHAAGQTGEYAFEIVAGGLLADMGGVELGGHVVEQGGEAAELVVAVHGQLLRIIALRHGACTGSQRENRRGEALGEKQGNHQREQNSQQGGHQEGEQEEGLQALLGIADFGVAGAGGFNQGNVVGHLFLHRLAEEQNIVLAVQFGQGKPALGVERVADVGYAAGAAGGFHLFENIAREFGRRQFVGIRLAVFGGGA